MSIFESIFYMMWRGLAIGVMISAPMGPVGILCIQRTLDKGRRTGLFTGIGAAISDLFYALLTGFGLSFIEDFLERNHDIIQLGGSVVLIAFSVYLFKKNPAKGIKKPMEAASTNLKRDILYGFLFTVSNPLIIFLIIGLFARFNFLNPELRFYDYIIGYIFLAAGALLWWWLVTGFINKVRGHFNLRSMWLINKFIGGIILLFAIVGIVTATSSLMTAPANARTINLNRARGYMPLSPTSEANIVIAPTSGNASQVSMPSDIGKQDFHIRWRAASHKSWGVILSDSLDNTLRFDFAIRESDNIISSQPEIHITRTLTIRGEQPVVSETTASSGIDATGGFNTFLLQRKSLTSPIYASDSDIESLRHYTLSIGFRQIAEIMNFNLDNFNIKKITFIGNNKKDTRISDIEVGTEEFRPRFFCGYKEVGDLRNRVRESPDKMEGSWKFLDGSFDTTLMAQGGDYTLVCVRHGDGYALVYAGGASTAAGAWVEGMIKGYLHYTPIGGVYDVEWIDASGLTVSRGIKAQRENDDVLSLQFPYQNASVRFLRIQ